MAIFLYVRIPMKMSHFKSIKPLSQLTLSWRRFVSCRNQSTDLLCKSIDWFLYGRDLRHERVNVFFKKGDYILMQFLCLICACLKIENMNYNDYKPHLKIQLLLWKYFRIGHTNANYAPTGLISLEVLIASDGRFREFQVDHKVLYPRNRTFFGVP